MKNTTYLKAAEFVHANNNYPTYGACLALRYNNCDAKELDLFTGFFRPTISEFRKYRMHFAYWLYSFNESAQQNNEFRIMCLLMMYEIINDKDQEL